MDFDTQSEARIEISLFSARPLVPIFTFRHVVHHLHRGFRTSHKLPLFPNHFDSVMIVASSLWCKIRLKSLKLLSKRSSLQLPNIFFGVHLGHLSIDEG